MSRSEKNMTIRQVKRRYYSVWLFYMFGGAFMFGVYPLFLRSRGLTQFQINSVLAVYFTVLFLTDVPTGAFADSLGRRTAFVLGCCLRVIAFMVYFFAHHYVFFLIAESIDGIGTTFGNGAIDAWGVDELDAAGFEGLKDGIFSRISQLSSVGAMAGAVIGAYVADVNISWPWLLGASGYLLSGVIGGLLMRADLGQRAQVRLRQSVGRLLGRMGAAVRYGFRSREVMLLSLANGIQFGALAPYWLEWPRYFSDGYGVGIWVVGWLWCLLSASRMIGAEAIVRVRSDNANRGSRLGVLIAGQGLLLFSAGTAGSQSTVVLLILFVMNLLTGAMQPLQQGWFNEHIQADDRATLLSFQSTFCTLGGALGLLLNGFVADRWGLPTAWQVSGIVALGAVPCYLALRSSDRAGRASQAASPLAPEAAGQILRAR
ncbi:MAG TPA: MFS transporter [Candidatus Binataceae bacterium]